MTRHFKSGEILFHEGERSRYVYRLVSGRMVVARHAPSGCEILGNLNPGDFIGEMGVLVASPRSGTARFTDDSVVEEFERQEFLKLVTKDPKLSARLLETLSLRTRAQTELLHRLPHTSSLAVKKLPGLFARLLHLLHEKLRVKLKSLPLMQRSRAFLKESPLPELVFKKGALMFSEGEASDSVLWIQSGAVRIVKRSEGDAVREAGVVVANEFLGEMGVLEMVPRSASAYAASDVTVRLLTPVQFLSLMQKSPAAYLTVIDSLCERARKLRRTILHETSASVCFAPEQDNLFDVVGSIDGVAQLAEQRLMDEASKMRRFFQVQLERGRFMASTYQRYLRGNVSRDEMEKANTYLRDYVKMAGLGTLIVLPGSPITIPLLAKVGKALGVDIFPSGEEALDHAEVFAAEATPEAPVNTGT